MKISEKISSISYYLKYNSVYAEIMQMKCVVHAFTPLIL